MGTYSLALSAQKVGVVVDPLLASVGLPPLSQITVDTPLTGLQEVEFLRAVMATVPHRSDLGLLGNGGTPLSFGGYLGYIFNGAPNLEEALIRNQRYMPLTWGMMDFELAEDGDDLLITFIRGELPTDVEPFYAQRNGRTLAAWTHDHGYQTPLRAQFAGAAPKDPRQLESFIRVFGTTPEFDAPASTLRIPLALARKPLSSTSATQFEGLREEAERQLASYLAGDSVVSKIRAHLRSSLPDDATLEATARSFFVAPRTLRRQLAAEDTSFRNVLDEVRAELADEQLRGPNVQISQMATALGYSSPPAFTAAFQRWFGCSPSEYRERVRDGASMSNA